jgi:hypothetical protein
VGRTSGQAALPRKSGRGLSGTTTTTTLTAHATEGTPTVLLPYHGRSLYTNRQSQSPDPNVLTFLQTSCPDDVLPRVLAFAGPQQIAVLQKTNRFWKTLLERDGTWRVLCEELYKVRNRTKEYTYMSIVFVYVCMSIARHRNGHPYRLAGFESVLCVDLVGWSVGRCLLVCVGLLCKYTCMLYCHSPCVSYRPSLSPPRLGRPNAVETRRRRTGLLEDLLPHESLCTR